MKREEFGAKGTGFSTIPNSMVAMERWDRLKCDNARERD